MKLKKLVSAVLALAILSLAVAAYANTTKYTGPTLNSETRVSGLAAAKDISELGLAQAAAKYDVADFGDTNAKLDGWGYHHAIINGETAGGAEHQSQLKLNQYGLLLMGGPADSGGYSTTGASYITFTPANAGYSEPTSAEATADSAGGTTSFYSFTIDITCNDSWGLNSAVEGRYVAVGFDVSGTQSTSVLGKLTEGKHTVYMTYRSIPNSDSTDRDWAEIYVDDSKVNGVKIENATGIYIKSASANRSSTVQISDFRYGYVNVKDDIQYTSGSIKQFKAADGYDRDATAAVLNVTSYEDVTGITVTETSGQSGIINTAIASGSTIKIGVIVNEIRDRNYIDQRFTITALN